MSQADRLAALVTALLFLLIVGGMQWLVTPRGPLSGSVTPTIASVR